MFLLNSVYGYLPLLGLFFLILLSASSLFLLKKSILFEIEAGDSVCQRGETVNVTVKIGNRSVLTYPKARISLHTSDFCDEEGAALSRTFILHGNRSSEFSFPVKMDHIGVYTIGVKRFQIYDLLGIFRLEIPGEKDFQVTVLPRIRVSDEIHLDEKQLTESQNIQKNNVSDGFDYTGVREYSIGDSIKRIHWKLSAHSSLYMTKITESSRKTDLTVVADLATATLYQEVMPDIYDCLVETALSFLEQVSCRDIDYALIFAGSHGEIIKTIPKGERDYPNLVRKLPSLLKRNDRDIASGAEILEKERHASNRGANLILCTSNVTDELVGQLILIRQQQRNPMLCCVVPANLELAEIAGIKKRLEILDEYNIRHHLIHAETA